MPLSEALQRRAIIFVTAAAQNDSATCVKPYFFSVGFDRYAAHAAVFANERFGGRSITHLDAASFDGAIKEIEEIDAARVGAFDGVFRNAVGVRQMRIIRVPPNGEFGLGLETTQKVL